MNRRISGWAMLFVLLFVSASKADVPPDFGETRVKVDLVIETGEDVSAYRFFLDFYGDLREVQVNSGGRTVIQPMGGGARYANGTLMAVPVRSLASAEKKLSDRQTPNSSGLEELKRAEGSIKLFNHTFIRDMSVLEKQTFAPPVYLLKRENNILTATAVEDPNLAAASRTYKYGLIVGGFLLSLGMLFLGILVFRKVSKKS